MFSLIARIIFLLIIVVGQQSNAGARISASSFNDPRYTFELTKLNATNSTLDFFRSYVDFFYLFISENQSKLPLTTSLQNNPGWCIGDAHIENFGVLLLQNNRPMFTTNDIDDSGPCPLGLDLVRFLISVHLFDKDIDLNKFVSAYVHGIRQDQFVMPDPVHEMMRKAQKEGTTPNPKKVVGNQLVREKNMTELSSQELIHVRAGLHVYDSVIPTPLQFLDAVATSKVGGGSGGLRRYEILLNSADGLLLLEMKEQVNPAIYPVSEGPIPDVVDRIATSLRLFQGPSASKYYQVTQVNGLSMLIRPRFDGNVGVKLNRSDKQITKDILQYEAYALGLLHAGSVANSDLWAQQLEAISKDTLASEIEKICEYFDQKYSSIK